MFLRVVEMGGFLGKQRERCFDIFKGINIILVVVAHSPLCNNELKRIIYCFHMPAFFWVYGAVYSEERHRKQGFLTVTFVKNKICRLAVPCVIWGVLYSCFSMELSLKNVLRIAYGNQKSFVAASSLSSLWFLPCMLLTVFGFEIVMDITDGQKDRRLVLIVIAIASAFFSSSLPSISFVYGYPCGLDAAPMGFALMACGYLFKQHIIKDKPKKTWIYFIYTLIACVGITISYRVNLEYIQINNVDMPSRSYGNMFLYLVAAFCGIFVTFMISFMIDYFGGMLANLLSMLGKITMPVFLIHKPVLIKLCEFITDKGLPRVTANILAVVGALLFSVIGALILQRKAPFLIGARV